MSNLMPVPHEISFGWIYFPPLFFAILFGVLTAWALHPDTAATRLGPVR